MVGEPTCRRWHDLYGVCELPYRHDGPYARVPGGSTEANTWTDAEGCACPRCQPLRHAKADAAGDLVAYAEALRAIVVLHDRAHWCSDGDREPHAWPAGQPCPTRVIADATLSRYGRGGAWPYPEEAGGR